MSQHISGSVGQNVSYDYGEFITIGDLRVRRSLIIGFGKANVPKDFLEKIPGTKPFGINIFISNDKLSPTFDTEEERDKELARLDWIFKGEETK